MIAIKKLKKRFTKLPYTLVFVISISLCFYFMNIRLPTLDMQESSQPLFHKKVLSDLRAQTKYILLWTSPYSIPFIYFGSGNGVFLNKECKWSNCFVTSDRSYLGDYTEFDVIAFNGPELLEHLTVGDIPIRRSVHQKYVYVNIDASSMYPLCTTKWNGFFNWTWTYKFNSDAVWSYIAVRNASNHVIGPNKNMNWLRLEEMNDIDEELKKKLSTKSKPAAWFSSNCMTQSLRENYVSDLQKHLKKYSMDINIYGKCGKFGCPKETMPQCLKTLKKHHYFYLAFENAVCEDYVTDRIVDALNHDTVPIVLGGANYSRFMPDGIYLNALNIKPKQLAAKMYHIIKNRTAYYDFFRWKNHYSYHKTHDSPDTDNFCKVCEIMNDEQLMNNITIYEHIDQWWTGSEMNSICHPTMKTN